ncbi:protein TIFY 6B-like [Chenopodium quinoa]|uniref:protein TIFY 6B-like n=1 Tax=Chenopodium quinoa TaxID=63459 RepID=UPI000B76D96F|nr:protein TIFY 6B-like [Chenopodium quinoa]
MRKSNLQWSFSTSQFLSFKSAQDQDGAHKQYPPTAFSQRKLGLDIQGGSQYPITGHHHWQPKDVLSLNQSSEVRIHPVTGQSNQIVPATIGSGTVTNISVTPPNGPVVGSTDLKSSPSIAIGSCQLTLFYNGSVCVYDNVSPEKAQAIMLLAGNGESKNPTSSPAAIPSLPKVQLPVPMQRPPTNDTAIPNQLAGLLSPISLPPSISSLPVVATSCAVEANPIKPVMSTAIKPVMAPPAHVKCPEPPKSGASVGAGVKSVLSAVPQARKASLTRFLEKRKERVTAASPYVVNKTAFGCSTKEPSGSNLATKYAPSSPLPASVVEIL